MTKEFIAGGCSFTFGHELSDDNEGKIPSEKTWAYRLMERLRGMKPGEFNNDYICTAKAGAGNQTIARRVFNAVANIQEIVNFLLLKGNFGRRGAGACPVRGHSNVQGDRTMGIWERPDQSFLNSLRQEFGFEPPSQYGLDTVDTIHAMADGRVKVFIALGGNFLAATPDTAFTARALENCQLTVQISTKLNRSHAVIGKTALILPTLGRTERDLQPAGPQFVTVENSMGVVTPSQGRLGQSNERYRKRDLRACDHERSAARARNR